MPGALSPDEILDSVPEGVRLARLHALVRIYVDVCEKRWQDTRLDRNVLLHAVENYFCDIVRTKAFHGIALADQHKRAAFTMKWIAKTRPIYLRPGSVPTKASYLANEAFALIAGLEHLDASPNRLSDGLCRNLLYTLHYRNLDGEVLSTLMYAIECGIKGKAP